MAWNALAKGLKLADERSFPANRDLWIAARDRILYEIMDKGWNEELQSFTPPTVRVWSTPRCCSC
jgi:GH15 family glucan-1,4-alpha-glucosidase